MLQVEKKREIAEFYGRIACNNVVGPQSELNAMNFTGGISLVFAMLGYAGWSDSDVEQIERNAFLFKNKNIKLPGSVDTCLKSYRHGSQTITAGGNPNIPIDLKSKFYERQFGCSNVAQVDVIRNNFPILVAPFDLEDNTGFIRRKVGFRSSPLPAFDYLKANVPPWTILWYSNNPKNDFFDYVQARSHKDGVETSVTAESIGAHEYLHFEVVNPVIGNICPTHCWLNEGLVTSATAPKKYLQRIFRSIDTNNLDIEHIANSGGYSGNRLGQVVDKDGEIAYANETLLTLAIGKLLFPDTDSAACLYKILASLYPLAYHMAKFCEDIDYNSPRIMLDHLMPKWRTDQSQQQILSAMNSVRDSYLSD